MDQTLTDPFDQELATCTGTPSQAPHDESPSRAAELLELDPDGFIGRPFQPFVPSEDLAAVEERFLETKAEELLRDADVATYAAENSGRGRYVVYSNGMEDREG